MAANEIDGGASGAAPQRRGSTKRSSSRDCAARIALEIAELERMLAASIDLPPSGAGPVRGGDLWRFARASAAELARDLRLSAAAAQRLATAFALARRLLAAPANVRTPVRSSAAVHRLLEAELRGLERETFVALLLDGKHCLKQREIVSVGTLTSSLVHPREVFRAAIREGAAALIAAHNHPSGDPEPSSEDFEVTRRLLSAGQLLGIPLLDHVIVGERRFVSLRQRMAFDATVPRAAYPPLARVR